MHDHRDACSRGTGSRSPLMLVLGSTSEIAGVCSVEHRRLRQISNRFGCRGSAPRRWRHSGGCAVCADSRGESGLRRFGPRRNSGGTASRDRRCLEHMPRPECAGILFPDRNVCARRLEPLVGRRFPEGDAGDASLVWNDRRRRELPLSASAVPARPNRRQGRTEPSNGAAARRILDLSWWRVDRGKRRHSSPEQRMGRTDRSFTRRSVLGDPDDEGRHGRRRSELDD